MVSVDASTLDVPDEAPNAQAFGRPTAQQGKSAYPQLRFVGLLEGGTHVMFATALGAYTDSETSLFGHLIARLKPDMVCLADRFFLGYKAVVQSPADGRPAAVARQEKCRVSREPGAA